ncbi:probable transcription factor At1g61730 [Solanum dulcamara]|uniref:probable transcription factor At1g61730 n=1 Tax=Solanum dulcamara TaxID=45834 RepID=UPI0024865A61|nr:probable transcription factor At1g61730 [Solanum dulcamara]
MALGKRNQIAYLIGVFHLQLKTKTCEMAAVNLSKNKKSKRPNTDDSDKEWMPSSGSDESHRKKLKNSDVVMKSGFQRVWSEEDEITILERYLNYSSLNCANPSSDYDAFVTFVKDGLQEETSKTQLQDKLTRLRRKYKKNVDKRSFSKPHQEKLFKLSKRIWGQVKPDKTIGIMCSDLVLGGGSAADLEDWFRRNPLQLISEKDREEMLEKSQSVKIGKARQYLSEIQVMEVQAKLAIHALHSILT